MWIKSAYFSQFRKARATAYFFLMGWDWVHLILRSLFGLLYQPQTIDDDSCGAIGGMRIGRGNWSTRREPAPVPLCPPQIPDDLTRARNQAAAVRSQRLTAWAMARPGQQPNSSFIHKLLFQVEETKGIKKTINWHNLSQNYEYYAHSEAGPLRSDRSSRDDHFCQESHLRWRVFYEVHDIEEKTDLTWHLQLLNELFIYFFKYLCGQFTEGVQSVYPEPDYNHCTVTGVTVGLCRTLEICVQFVQKQHVFARVPLWCQLGLRTRHSSHAPKGDNLGALSRAIALATQIKDVHSQ
jgi:hypothetical protein